MGDAPTVLLPRAAATSSVGSMHVTTKHTHAHSGTLPQTPPAPPWSTSTSTSTTRHGERDTYAHEGSLMFGFMP